MKSHIKHITVYLKKAGLFFVALCACCTMHAQHIDEILSQIEKNNPQLCAKDKARNAEKIELKTTNNLGGTAVSYSPFYANGVHGVASSELVVSQDFDFPTLYAQRSKMIKKQSDVLDSQYESLRRDVLNEARLLCIQLVHRRKLSALLEKQAKHINTLVGLYETKYNQGEATAMEINKVKIEAMKLATDIANCNADISNIATTLKAMNGNKDIPLDITEYPTISALPDDATLLAQYMANDRELHTLKLETEALERNVKISRHENLPSLSVGYRRNTALEERSHGFLVGASVPLFSNRNRTRAAKAKVESVQSEAEHLRLHTEADVKSMIEQIHNIRKALDAYDANLMQSAIETLQKACDNGEITFIDFCREQTDILQKMQEMLQLEQQYHLIVTNLLKNS